MTTTVKTFKPSGAPFSPSDIAGLALWLDASDASSLTITSSPDVDQWDDKSGNGNHVSQGSAALKPHTGGSINSLNTLIFDGADDYMQNTTAGGTLTGTKGTIFIVNKIGTLDGLANVALCSANTAVANSYIIFGIDRGSPTPNPSIQSQNTGLNWIYGDTTLTTATPYIHRFSSNDTNWVMAVDGVVQGETVGGGSDTGIWFGDVASRNNMAVGAIVRSTVSNRYDGELAEIIVYDGVDLTAQNVTDVETYLADKWGVTI